MQTQAPPSPAQKQAFDDIAATIRLTGGLTLSQLAEISGLENFNYPELGQARLGRSSQKPPLRRNIRGAHAYNRNASRCDAAFGHC